MHRELHNDSFANRFGKGIAKPLSRMVCSRSLYRPFRLMDAYLNFLFGRGAGTGWDMGEEVRAAVARIHRSRPVVFDVGANVGSWSQMLLQAIPDAHVYMFEPSPGCQEAIRQKALKGARLFGCALGEAPEQKTYYASGDTDSGASFYTRRDTPFKDFAYQQSTVVVRTLDEVIVEEKIDFVDFLKMDIEGHELFALRGAKQALEARRIGALSFEFGCGNVNSRTFFRDFWELLTTSNFAIQRITPGGKDILVEDYYEDAEYFRGATNFVAELKK